ncbi:MAG: FGGY family carbohydrate kinase [Hungatella hathewayi]
MRDMPLMLAIDLGSSQLKLLVMDENARVRAVVTEGYPTLTPGPGYLVQRPEDWRKALERGFARMSELVELAEIEVVSFSGHMSGLVMVDGEGGVLYPCVMLSDCRSGEECRILEKCVGDEIRRMSGNPVIDAFSLPKLLWMKRNEGEIYRRSRWWVSPKDCVRFWFTGKMETEYTDAYNSLCVDRRTVGGCCEKEDETGGGDGWKACAEADRKREPAGGRRR